MLTLANSQPSNVDEETALSVDADFKTSLSPSSERGKFCLVADEMLSRFSIARRFAEV